MQSVREQLTWQKARRANYSEEESVFIEKFQQERTLHLPAALVKRISS